MDPHALYQCFAGTLEVSLAVRENAERELHQLAQQPGFLGACLDIIGANEVSPGCKKAAAVYFKNQMVRYWTRDGDKIDAGERPVILGRFVSVLAAVDFTTKHQLLPVFRTLVSAEYPDGWPALLPEIGDLLQKHDDLSSMYTGVTCFTEVCRSYRYVENKLRENQLDPIIVQVFPHLLDVGNAILQGEITETTADLLKQILKAYKFVTYFDLPRVLQLQAELGKWGDFHCRVVALTPPSYVLQPLAELERAQTQIAKCYKWAVANMERLFRRYGSRDLSLKRKLELFRAMFAAEIMPHVMQIFLSIIEQYCAGERWFPNPAMYHLLDFLSHAVTQKELWQILQPCYASLVEHLVYPLLCPSEETLELFETDPADYINTKLDNFDECEPDIAALGFLVTLILKRKKHTAPSIVEFAVGQISSLSQQPDLLSVAIKKDGALRLIGGVSHILTPQALPYATQMEPFVAQYVLPCLASKHEFLRARALDVCAKFADLQLQDVSTKQALYQGILEAFTADAEAVSLPVMLQSALAVQAYMSHGDFCLILGTIIVPTMSKLLELSGEIDNEAVSVVMQECVENFAPQLQPFGVDLMQNLVTQFMRLAVEIFDAGNQLDPVEYDADAGDALSDKITAALGLLNTMITVLLSFENSKAVCIQLEETFLPAIAYVLEHGMDDFIAEVGELIENSIFLLRAVSPLMWTHFARLADSFTQGVALMYAEDMVPCLKNYAVFGAAHLAENHAYTEKYVQIVSFVLTGDDEPDYSDITLACELGQTLILALQQNALLVIPQLAKIILPVLAQNQVDAAHTTYDTVMVNAVGFVVACLMYDTAATVQLLQQTQYLTTFFELWLAFVPKPKRVYDVKLLILGFVRLANSPEVAAVIPSFTAHVGKALAALFRELPRALKNLEKQRTEFDSGEYRDSVFGGDFDDFDDFDDEVYDSDGDDPDAATDKYQKFLSEESNKFLEAEADEKDAVFEDVLGATPLDSIDPVVVFKDFSANLQTNNTALYNAIFENVDDDDRQVFVEVFKAS
ncbi:Importin-beta N-terminal domain-containing protein [Metschnikowia aff. pulcherrima]|uniref:Importin-beta N-terminal domain-containing protein n=1 Tax=Metschnikowia aff. pulcherrima TaxID=2163413 RepID=A0A4P6XMM5_9ASCO|nr:Importin-beta N-terminal domain-containing protein [Metschnikowia aff. pulcherrima]